MTAERRFWVWVGVLAGFCLLLSLLRDVLMPFLAGMGIAYLLDPLADRLERLGVPRGFAAAAIILSSFIVFGAFLTIVVPALQAQVAGLIIALPDYLATLAKTLKPLVKQLRAELSPEQFTRLSELFSQQSANVMTIVARLFSNVVSGGLALASFLSLVLITPVVAFYLLRDWDRLVAALDELLPRRSAPVIRALVREIDRRLSGFVRGQGLVCLALASYYGIGLSLVGLNFGLLIGLGAGLISFIPYFGTIVGFILSMGVAIAQYGSDGWSIGIVAAVFVSGQLLEGNVITPWLVGDRVGLHPVWIMFAILAGGSLLGFTGVLVAVPAAAVIGVIVRFGLDRYRASALYGPLPPPADEATTAEPSV